MKRNQLIILRLIVGWEIFWIDNSSLDEVNDKATTSKTSYHYSRYQSIVLRIPLQQKRKLGNVLTGKILIPIVAHFFSTGLPFGQTWRREGTQCQFQSPASVHKWIWVGRIHIQLASLSARCSNWKRKTNQFKDNIEVSNGNAGCLVFFWYRAFSHVLGQNFNQLFFF